jgi:nicotinamide-nucleotide amidase
MYTSRAAEILTIGDELTRGEIVDTNAAWLAERLTDLGFHVRWHSSTTDDPGDMRAAFRLAASRADVVLCSGGLGPTEDDRTVDVVAELVGAPPVVDEEQREKMARRFAERGFELTPNNLRQVRVPGGSEVLPNRAGLAPGFHVRLAAEAAGARGAELYVMPGVPREMKRIYDEEVEPRLRASLSASGGGTLATARRVWRAAAIGESHVDHRLRGLLDGIADATLHFRIAFPENLVTVVVRRASAAEAEAVLDRLDGEVRARLGEHMYATGDETLPRVIGARLRERGETLATAESCTGGLVGDMITDVPGSSDYYRGGVIAYSNALKRELLGVRAATLDEHGAVSEACVREMAAGARATVGADWSIAISGIAGPGGGTADKPVGLVHFAVACPDGRTEARKLLWPAERRMVKQLAAHAALFLLHRQLGEAGEPGRKSGGTR